MNLMATNLSFHLCFFFMFMFSCETLIEAHQAARFSVQLLRRNSGSSTFQKPSEFYKPSCQEGGTTRVKSLHKGDYLMKITVGTPPMDMYGLFDTASDLIWAQCTPCHGCFKQKKPMFNPKKSKTYRNTRCNTEQQCNWVPGNCSKHNLCAYNYGYADGSYTNGVLARETITFSSTTGKHFVKDIVFGCGHNNSGTFNENDMGIVGMGGGPLSLVSQMGTQFGGRRFSQCLVPFNAHHNFSGTVSFGADSEVSGEGVVTTPLILGHNDTYYLVTLKGISVGNTFVHFNSSQQISKGNILIDSGTPSSWIPKEFYDGLLRELKAQIKLKPISNDPGQALCYESNTTLEWPVLTLHFEGGDLEISPAQNISSPQDGVFCFELAWPTNDQSVFGNFAQSNILIGFDLDKKIVSFKPTDCAKQLKLVE